MRTERELLDEMQGRYLFDAEFHALVETVVGIASLELLRDRGGRLTTEDESAVRMGAALALVVKDQGGRRLQVNPEPLVVVDVGRCSGCGRRAPWCSCGKADYQ